MHADTGVMFTVEVSLAFYQAGSLSCGPLSFVCDGGLGDMCGYKAASELRAAPATVRYSVW